MLMLTGMLLLLMIGDAAPHGWSRFRQWHSGRSRGKLYAQEEIEETFECVAGADEAVDELREVVDFLKNPDRYQRLGGRIPKGVLLVGPPRYGEDLVGKSSSWRSGCTVL